MNAMTASATVLTVGVEPAELGSSHHLACFPIENRRTDTRRVEPRLERGVDAVGRDCLPEDDPQLTADLPSERVPTIVSLWTSSTRGRRGAELGFPENLVIVGVMLLQMAVPIGAVVVGLWLFARSETGRAFMRRMRGGDIDPVFVHQLAEEVSALREELTAVQERLDFAERARVEPRRESPPFDQPRERTETSRP
jgi:hypothetical protein